MSKQTVNLSDQMVEEIQRCAMDRKEPVKGAVQRTLARGAELALAELRGVLPVTGGNIAPNTQSGVEKPKLRDYNSLHVVEAARRVAESLKGIAADLETAMENDVHTASSDEPAVSDEEREQARYAALSERATELLQSARTAHEQHRRNEADIERNKRRNDRKTSGGAA